MSREPKNPSNIPFLLNQCIPIADGIAKTFAPFCEVVLHDLRTPESSLIYIAGNLTNREIGAPVTDLVLRKLKKYGNETEDIIGYKATANESGKEFKSSTIFIRNEDGEIVGCMCINFEVTQISWATGVLENLCKFGNEKVNESFALNVKETLENIIAETISEFNKPVQYMTKNEKIKIISVLDEKGVFLVKGAVDEVANNLAVSKFTIYNYLDESRANKKEPIIQN